MHSEMKGAEKKERISNANVGQVPAQTAEEGEAAGYCWLGGVQSAEARRRTRHSSRGGSRRRVATPRAEGQENIAQVTGGERVVASARAPHDGCTGAATTHGGDMGRAAGAGRLTTSVPAPARGWGRICRGKRRDVKQAVGATGGRPRGGQAARWPSVRPRAQQRKRA